MAKYAVVWVPNGFKPKDPLHTDVFSQASLKLASVRYHEIKRHGHEVCWPIQVSALHFAGSQRNLWLTIYADSLAAGIDMHDTAFLNTEELLGIDQLNALTDGAAYASYFKINPVDYAEFYTATPEVVGYFRKTYQAGAKYIARYPEFRFEMIPARGVTPTRKWIRIYRALEFATDIVAVNTFTYRAWYRFRCWRDSGRRQGFVRTLEEEGR